MKLAGVIRESIVDGPGYRFVVFAQGCPHRCKGCHNPETHDFNGGYQSNQTDLLDEIARNPLLQGVTLTGGEPFCQAKEMGDFAAAVREKGLDVVTYTGYTFEELIAGATQENGWMALLQQTDLLIDGRFELAEKTLMLKFRGSKNQRIIDIPASLEQNRAIEIEI